MGLRVLHIGNVCGHGGTETVLATLIRDQRTSGIDSEAYFFVDAGGETHFRDVCRIRFAGRDSLTRILLSDRFDLVHVVSGATPSAGPCLRRSFFAGPVVVSCHGTFLGSLDSEHITAVSDHTARSIQGRCSSPVTVVHNGVDTTRFSPGEVKAEGKPIIAWVGRTTDPLKGFDGLIAFANGEMSSGFRLIVVDGADTDLDYDLWLPEGTIVIRRKPWREMPDFYRMVRASRGFVLSTSRTESFGLCLAEAGACGCPIVAPGVGGVPEVVDHLRTGYLYGREEASRGILDGIRWIYDGDNYETISERGIEHVRRELSSERMRDNYSEVYARALDTARPSGARSVSRWLLRTALAGKRGLRARDRIDH